MAELEPSAAREHPSCPPEFSIVGIGASAGGLEACSALLRNLPADTGMAFVVVQHLDPKHESLLSALLAKATKIPVKTVQDEMAVAPNQVYVMPPNWEIVFSDGMLRLIPREKTPRRVHMPIDGFFRSLAENCRHRAIGVILSGTGTDGALGLETIKAEGGFTFAQDTQSAKFDGMPHSAFVTGSVDFVLPPERIALELIKVSKYPYAKRIESVVKRGEASRDRPPLDAILVFLRKASGIDFSQYRSSTIRRRIFRRMTLNHIADADGYRRFLAEAPHEVELLCEEMIPRVTKFFRDPEVFASLQKQVFPQFLINRGGEKTVRIWVPGCASGEEVYAIAICLLELLTENAANLSIQIFGTDLSAAAVQRARGGLYPAKIAEDVSPERLQRFFVERADGYQISSRIREICVFAGHDLLSDPPYSKLDLISCRNVLIYLNSGQARIIPMFHYALRPTGFLMLGAMETARRFSELFAPLEENSPIYSKKPMSPRQLRSWGSVSAKAPGKTRISSEVWEEADVQKRADRAALARYVPPGVVVNENWQVLQVRGQVSSYLEPASGKMSVNVITMAKRSGLSHHLAAALDRARKENAPVRKENIFVPHEEIKVNLQVIPLSTQEDKSRFFLILFEEVHWDKAASRDNLEKGPPPLKGEFLKLQRELAVMRERMAEMLDNHQQFTEDSQSAQEESLSSLEEVQSFNEELETAKEELQSTNEELSTVNEELQTRNSELQQSRDFTVSVVETAHVPLVVLDSALRIRMANHAFYQTFRLSKQDTEGFAIHDVAQGALDTPKLRALIQQVLPENRAFEDFELDRDFPNAGRKTVCINARRLNGDEMILMSLDDVTARRQAEMELRRLQDELRQGQKMEAIGRLAGGVAHDFNNMLTGILGFSGLLMDNLQPGTDAFRQAEEIRDAGERAATLTHQLLAFSRRQVLRPQVLSLNTVILEMDKMLNRLIGEDVALEESLDPELWPVYADPGQMSQVILNLTLNARDAMPHGGALSIRTGNTRVEGEPVRGLAPGRYVTLTVTDCGTGMDHETQQHIFEPFYTTKPPGLGTGLGLATVFGIVQQSAGSIHFVSDLGLGTTFWVDLPRVEAGLGTGPLQTPAAMPTGTETVVVVEDEDLVRRLAVQILKRLGYNVLEANQGSVGLALCQAHSARIDLLLTDVLMRSGLNGRELAEQVIAIHPETKILLMSGYTTDALVHYGVKTGAPFLQKPFTLHQLAQKVREVLDSQR